LSLGGSNPSILTILRGMGLLGVVVRLAPELQVGSNPTSSTINIIMKTCAICGETFTNGRVYSNHIRWKHKSKTTKCSHCDIEFKCGLAAHIERCDLNPKNHNPCKVCGSPMSKYQKIFCSNSCSAKHNNTKKTVQELHRKCTKCEQHFIAYRDNKIDCNKCIRQKNNRERRSKNTCTICGDIFLAHNSKVKTCSSSCKNNLHSRHSISNPNCGGETNYRRYFYRDIMFDSQWEIDIAEFLDKNNIKWSRSRKHLLYWIDSEGRKRRYYPDFLLIDFNVYVDPKNPYKQLLDKEKLDYIKQHHTLIVGNVEECKQQILSLV
jgi:hypothetical protein